MRAFKIFYSWQSDREPKSCKDFIRKAADAAAAKAAERLGVSVLIEADTEGAPGTPAISDTILRKIDDCDFFLGDMTFVGLTASGKMLPNPNVMGEYGYALKSKGLDRILLAMNTAFGPPEELPFDLRHLRHPARYKLEAGSPDGPRRKARADFAECLERNIRVAIEHLMKQPTVSPSPRWDEAEAAIAEFSDSRRAHGQPVLVSAPRLVVCVIPIAALDGPRLAAASVKEARPWFAPSITALVKEGADEAQWWAADPPRRRAELPNPEARWSFCLVRPGFFEVSATLGDRIDDDPTIVIEGKDIEIGLVKAVDRVATVASRIGLQGPAVVAAWLEGIEDVEIHRPRPGTGGRRIRRQSAPLGTVRFENFASPSADGLADLMERMWIVGGWDDGSPYIANGRCTGYR